MTVRNIALTRAQRVMAVKEVIRGAAAFPMPALSAKGTITLTGVPNLDETLTIGAQVFVIKNARAQAGQVTKGLDAAECVANIIEAVTTDLPNLVAAAAGAGTTVIITSRALGYPGNLIVLESTLSNATVDGEGFLGGTQAGSYGCEIIGEGAWDINQQPTFTDSPEIVYSRDVLERFMDMLPPGQWSGKMLVRPSGYPGVAPMGDVLYESLMGIKSVNGGVSIVYSQALTKPSFTLWVQKDHTVFFLTGATLSKAKFGVTNKGASGVDMSGEGMRKGWAGTDKLIADKAVGQTSLDVADAKKFTVDARIWNLTKNDSNGGLGYKITAVDPDASPNTITITPAIPAGGWSNNDVIAGFLPAGCKIGEALDAFKTAVTIDSITTPLKSADINFDDGVKYADDEIPGDGTDYITDYTEDARGISGTINRKFRKDLVGDFYKALHNQNVPMEVIFGNMPGSRLRIFMPNVNLESPKTSDSSPVVDIATNFKAQGVNGEDSAELKFY